jgi:flagellar basal-body rod protein FlgG
MLGTGVRIVATEKTHTQGSLVTTKNALDLAMQGDGFFQIAQSDGTIAYSRDGSFKLSATGQLVTANGAPLQPAITIPPNVASISIGQDGTVSVETAAGGGAQVLGQIQIARFSNPAGLQAIGQNLLKETTASGAPVVSQPGQAGAGQLMQGALEASNVNVVEEMVNMIETQRAYEINSKAISAVDGMLRFLNNNM